MKSKVDQSQLDSAMFKKLQDLASKIPGDPILYRDQIQKYSNLYKEQFTKLLENLQKKNDRFAELLIFLSKSVKYYPKQLSYVPGQVIDLLKNHGPNLHPYVRKKCVGSIMVLRAKNILYPTETTQFLLTLFNIEDKQLRKILYKYILNDIRRMNKNHKNVKINQQIRDYIYLNVIKNSDKMAQKAVQLMVDLYKRNLWTDNRCVNIISEGCFSQSSKIKMISCHFLIATTEHLQELEDSDEDDLVNPSDITFKKGIRKHTKNNEKKVVKQKKRAERRLRKRQIEGRRVNFMPIDVIYNPQDFAQKLFLQISRKSAKFTHKIVCFGLLSRLIWRHKLILLPFYTHISKYLEPKQKQVAKILTYLAESLHQNIPDDDIESILKIIIEKFVNDKCSEYTMTIGLNTIREIYSKLPGIITEQAMLYLATYHQYKNKNVSRATKSLINLVRQINPYLLEKKYRGRTFADETVIPFGVNRCKVKDTIEGAELLNHEGNVPIYMDRILSDQDFRLIRKLKRKQESEELDAQLAGDSEQMVNQGSVIQQEQEGEDEDEEDEKQSESDSEDEEIDWEDCEEIEELVQGQGYQEDQIEDQQGSDQSDDEDDENEDEDDEDEDENDDERKKVEESKKITTNNAIGKKQRMKKKLDAINEKKRNEKINRRNDGASGRKRRAMEKELQSDSYEESSSENENPHGFINVNQIGFYKKSKTQIKAQKKQNPQKKQKFKHTPKESKKGGGTTNREKQKLKPLMMVRAKKNQIRGKEKQVKQTIKNLKNQLGKVRSQKQATKRKNKKIVKQIKNK